MGSAKFLLLSMLLVSLLFECKGQDSEEDGEDSGWWTSFKKQVKSVLRKWRDDLSLLWDQVTAKATDMRSWTNDMFESFKVKMKEWVQNRPDVPESEKNEMENFISKLKMPTESPKSDEP